MSEPPAEPKTAMSGLLGLAVVGTALGFGVALSSLYSLKRTAAGLAFEFRGGTIPVFLVGAAAGWLFWKILIQLNSPVPGQGAPNGRKLVLFYVVSLLTGLAMFLYPIRFLKEEQHLSDVSLGVLFGFLAASVGGFFLWRTIRLLESDSERQAEKERGSNEKP